MVGGSITSRPICSRCPDSSPSHQVHTQFTNIFELFITCLTIHKIQNLFLHTPHSHHTTPPKTSPKKRNSTQTFKSMLNNQAINIDIKRYKRSSRKKEETGKRRKKITRKMKKPPQSSTISPDHAKEKISYTRKSHHRKSSTSQLRVFQEPVLEPEEGERTRDQ